MIVILLKNCVSDDKSRDVDDVTSTHDDSLSRLALNLRGGAGSISRGKYVSGGVHVPHSGGLDPSQGSANQFDIPAPIVYIQNIYSTEGGWS